MESPTLSLDRKRDAMQGEFLGERGGKSNDFDAQARRNSAMDSRSKCRRIRKRNVAFKVKNPVSATACKIRREAYGDSASSQILPGADYHDGWNTDRRSGAASDAGPADAARRLAPARVRSRAARLRSGVARR